MHLAIDPGLNNIGYAWFDKDKLISYGYLKTSHPKLSHIFHTINDILTTINPSYCLLEKTFVRNNALTSLKLSEARGVILLSLELHKIPTYEINANSARKVVIGTSKLTKDQLIAYVENKFNKIVNHHVADAIILALYPKELLHKHLPK